MHRVLVHARPETFDRVHDQLEQPSNDRLEEARVVGIVGFDEGAWSQDHASWVSTLRAMASHIRDEDLASRQVAPT
jgi:hypothetical protein